MTDDLASAVLDLSVLPRSDRRAILAALLPEERRQIEAVMNSAPPAMAAEVSLHSPWFVGLRHCGRTTAAARALLAGASKLKPATEAPRPSGRSLMQAAGGLLAHAGSHR